MRVLGASIILRRLSANLKAQNWTAVNIDFVLVVAGVFLGVQASNWNQARLERGETRELLHQLSPELHRLSDFSGHASAYYGNARAYAETAFRGWRNDPRVNDRDFVIAAYQASQILGPTTARAGRSFLVAGSFARWRTRRSEANSHVL